MLEGRRQSFQPAALRSQFRGFLADWNALLEGNVSNARGLLSVVLPERIAFKPLPSGEYELTVPIAYDRMFSAVIPALRNLSDCVASLTGFEPVSRP